MVSPDNNCLIWPDHAAAFDNGEEGDLQVDSLRAGGAYVINAHLLDDLSSLSDTEKVNLTGLLVEQRANGVLLPRVSQTLILGAKTRRKKRVSERAERLLRYLIDSSKIVGDSVNLDAHLGPALAWSESLEEQEVRFLVKHLEYSGWIQTTEQGLEVLVPGYDHVDESEFLIEVSQAFVAMWFSPEMDEAYEDGIRPAIENAGYYPMRIDRKPDVDYIDDEIIAEINRSRFLVADFTHGEDGPRGGVYYEAGHANGRGMPVFLTCRKDQEDSVHFDTRQRYHIFWETPVQLRDRLQERIVAVVGDATPEE